jgi:hypothetical protein
MSLARICLHAIAARRQDQYGRNPTQQRLNTATTVKKQIANCRSCPIAKISNKQQTTNYQQSAAIQNAEDDNNLSFDRIKQILVMQFWMKK